MRNRLTVGSILALVIMTALTARGFADGIETLPVPTITIYPGDVIADGMLADQAFPAGTGAGVASLAARQDIVGKVARRTLLPGKPIAAGAIAEPDLVRRGTIIRA